MAEAVEIEEEVLVGFFGEDGSQYGRMRLAVLRERNWPKRVEAWDHLQRVHPTHFARVPAFTLPPAPETAEAGA